MQSLRRFLAGGNIITTVWLIDKNCRTQAVAVTLN